MSLTKLALLALGLAPLAFADAPTYTLVDNYSPDNFFSMFTFFTGWDPTNGFVQYVNQSVAQSTGLISTSKDSVYIGVDHTNITPYGRPSVRLTSTKAYNHGLIVLDLSHMPHGCGTWPAFWTVGPNWPSNGEIDIIEGVHTTTSDTLTLHTSNNCTTTPSSAANLFTGTLSTSNCFVNAPNQGNNAGCGIAANNDTTYGAGLNAVGGGIYATEWTDAAISIWFFPRAYIPHDLLHGDHPQPGSAGWGEPLAQWTTAGCDIDTHIRDQQIVFDDTFCGDWAGNVWQYYPQCAPLASSCNAYVANNRSAFADAYWTVNSLKVYQVGGKGESHSPGHAPYGIGSSLAPQISALAPIPKDDGPGK